MPTPQEDPLVRSSRREAVIVSAMFLTTMAYTLTYCGIHGYGDDATIDPLVFGFPNWIFYGVIIPWGLCTIMSVVYALVFITDDPLGEAAESWNPDGVDPLPSQEQSHA